MPIINILSHKSKVLYLQFIINLIYIKKNISRTFFHLYRRFLMPQLHIRTTLVMPFLSYDKSFVQKTNVHLLLYYITRKKRSINFYIHRKTFVKAIDFIIFTQKLYRFSQFINSYPHAFPQVVDNYPSSLAFPSPNILYFPGNIVPFSLNFYRFLILFSLSFHIYFV